MGRNVKSMWTGRHCPTESTRSNCGMSMSGMFRPTSSFSVSASVSSRFPAVGTPVPSLCSFTPDRAVWASDRKRPVQLQFRKLPFHKREATEQNEGVKQIALQRIAQEGQGGSVAGAQSRQRVRIHLIQCPDPEIRGYKEQQGTRDRRAGDQRGRTMLLQPQTDTDDQRERAINHKH